MHNFWSTTVWPDDGIKRLPISPILPKKHLNNFLHGSCSIWNRPKSYQNIGATFVRKFVIKNIKKSPNLVTLTNKQFGQPAWLTCYSGDRNFSDTLILWKEYFKVGFELRTVGSDKLTSTTVSHPHLGLDPTLGVVFKDEFFCQTLGLSEFNILLIFWSLPDF